MKACTRCGETKPLDAFYPQVEGRCGCSTRCKPCVKAANEEWRRANRDKHRAASKRYRERHPDIQNAAVARWAERNRERKIATRKAYHAANRERLNQQIRALSATPHGRMLKRIRQSKRRATQLAATVGPVNLPAVFDRDGGRCWICWRSVIIEHTHFDHVIPLSKGGEHSEDNIRVSCAPCNLRKRDHLPTPELIARIHEETLAVAA